jgi:hypothetical protein
MRVTVYTSSQNKALTVAAFLVGDKFRLGRVQPGNVSEDKIERVRRTGLFDVISVFGTTDMFSHSYFTSNSDVSSDLIALIRYGAKPLMHCGHSSRSIGRFDGSTHQRILRVNGPGFRLALRHQGEPTIRMRFSCKRYRRMVYGARKALQ